MIAFPIPVPGGAPPIVGVLFGLVAVAGFAVLVWQAVRYFRDHRDDGADDDRRERDDRPGDGPPRG